MRRAEGKVALITGAARGQGRSHALRLAAEGADIVALDICRDIGSADYPGATEADLAETVHQVEALDRRIVARKGDVRDSKALQAVVDDGIAEFGHIDVLCANAGIVGFGPTWELTDEAWQEVIDINLTGAWKTTRAVVPHMIERGNGGSIILTSSVGGLHGAANLAHYTAAKHGVVGLMRVLAVELAPHRIRVNTVHPSTVDTPMVDNDATRRLFAPHLESPTKGDVADIAHSLNALPVPWIEPIDVSNAVLYLASDESRYVTGTTMVIDAGASSPFKIPDSK